MNTSTRTWPKGGFMSGASVQTTATLDEKPRPKMVPDHAMQADDHVLCYPRSDARR